MISFRFLKQYGWYWGPISGEAAEKILSNEPDGSFIVRDSSDDHYIFSLSFRLNSCVRHVRIEHDQGKFCRARDSQRNGYALNRIFLSAHR